MVFVSFSFSPPAGLTGAPGDATCGNCHFGGSQTGSIDISGIVDVDNPIIPNKTYNVTVTINLISGTSPRAGFQFVALEGNGPSSPSFGTFSNLGTNVGTSTFGGRTYVHHFGGENSYSGSQVTYTFDWTAPAPSTSNVSFYATGLIANGSGTGGDIIVFDSDQNIVLPVELVGFEASKLSSNEISLRWTTLNEANSDYFEVLRSDDGVDFKAIDRVAAAENSLVAIDYEFRDSDPLPHQTSYYRLKIVDLDGKYEYSDVVVVRNFNEYEMSLNLFPNPARKDFCLFVDLVSDIERPNATVRIFDINGVSFLNDPQMIAGVKKGFNKLVLDINTLPEGNYILGVFDGNEILKSEKFIVAY